MDFIEKLGKLVGKYFAIIIIAIAADALLQPTNFLWVVPRVSLLLGIIMFGMGMTLKKEDFKEVFTRPKDVFIGVVCHYVIMPAIAYTLCLVFNLPKELAIGVILVGCCPSGTSSNVMCYLAKGDLALAVSIGAVSTLCAPILMPGLILLLAGKWISIPALKLFIEIVKIIVVPILLGVIINSLLGEKVQKATKALPLVSTIAIALIVGGVVGANSKRLMATSLLIIVVVLIHNLSGYLLGYLSSKALGMVEAKRRAVTLEVGMQNSALGVSLAMSFFTPAVAIPAVIFSVWLTMTGSTLASFWSTREPKKAGNLTEKLAAEI
jgi:Predicted Na+-dependent transporter